jgi:hypothetical protein
VKSVAWSALRSGDGGTGVRFRQAAPQGAAVKPKRSSGALVPRRTILRWSAAGALGAGLGTAQGLAPPFLAERGLLSADGVFAATGTGLSNELFYIEEFPTSPLIISPFNDELPIPRAFAPVPTSEVSAWPQPPGPGPGQQNSFGNETHQLWTSDIGFPDPIVYKIDLLVRPHAFTTSMVLPIDSEGAPTASFDEFGRTFAAPTKRYLRRARSTGSTAPSQGRGSTLSTASPAWCGSRTTSTRTRSGSTGRTSGLPTSRS